MMLKLLLALFLCMATYAEAELKITAFAGSTRSQSVHQKLLEEATKIARLHGAEVQLIKLKELEIPFYDGDLEQNSGMPLGAKKLRNLMIESDIILIASPEYNGSVSAVLKNALDWVSRSEAGGSSRQAYAGENGKKKIFFLMSSSPGKGGGAGHLDHLKSIIERIGGLVYHETFSLAQSHLYFEENADSQTDRQVVTQKLEPIIRRVLEFAAK